MILVGVVGSKYAQLRYKAFNYIFKRLTWQSILSPPIQHIRTHLRQ